MITFWLTAKKTTILVVAALMIGLFALADASTGPSLGILYVLPMIMAALVLNFTETLALAIVCAAIRYRFDYLSSTRTEIILAFVFATSAYASTGLLVGALVRNRKMVSDHLNRLREEQALRKEAEEQLKELVASSPAAILTVDSSGIRFTSDLPGTISRNDAPWLNTRTSSV